MKLTGYLILFLSIPLLHLSCDCTETDLSGIVRTWQIVSVHTVDSTDPNLNPEDNLTITFHDDQTYDLSLEVNKCQGNYSVWENDSIEISYPVCTEMCCDSEFSGKLLGLLPYTTTYRIDRSRLLLYAENGFVKLENVP